MVGLFSRLGTLEEGREKKVFHSDLLCLPFAMTE